jgi:DNA transposition AAA+ family ATPase
MITPDTPTAPPADTAQAPKDPLTLATHDADATRALVLAGDTVRASWRFSMDHVRSNIAYMSPEAKELLVWAFSWCIDPEHPVPFALFCERVGYAENTVWKMYAGKYKHPETDKLMDAPEKFLKAIRDFRRIEVSRAKLGRAKFVMTPTAKRFYQACDLARKSQTPVFIYGASQLGKTEAARKYCFDNNHGKSILVELEAVNGLRGLLQAVAVKVGVSPNSTTPDLIERIKKAVTGDMVVILDEVHLLANVYLRGSFFKCMETVRRLFVDHCKCGLVLTFTILGYTVAEKEKARELEQIFRRGVHRVNLGDRPSVADVTAIVRAWGLDMPARAEEITLRTGRDGKGTEYHEQPYVRLAQLAKEDGLKAIVERLRAASELASDKEAELTWEHFVYADLLIKKNAETPAHGWVG